MQTRVVNRQIARTCPYSFYSQPFMIDSKPRGKYDVHGVYFRHPNLSYKCFNFYFTTFPFLSFSAVVVVGIDRIPGCCMRERAFVFIECLFRITITNATCQCSENLCHAVEQQSSSMIIIAAAHNECFLPFCSMWNKNTRSLRMATKNILNETCLNRFGEFDTGNSRSKFTKVRDEKMLYFH